MVRGRSPEQKRPPRLIVVRSPVGNFAQVRHDLDDAVVGAIEALLAQEPQPDDLRDPPAGANEYARLLGTSPPDPRDGGPIYVFPPRLIFEHPALLIRSGTPEGDRLVERLDGEGMPAAMLAMGFVDTGELWAPWCVALDGDEIASVAFTVGPEPGSAEVGVATMPAFRGRGLAAAATAGWATHPDLLGYRLFYSTSWSNTSSQRVTERLGLRTLGARFTID
jgi:hypothetical protein